MAMDSMDEAMKMVASPLVFLMGLQLHHVDRDEDSEQLQPQVEGEKLEKLQAERARFRH